VLIPVEGERWILTLIGIGQDIPPADAAGFDRSPATCPSTTCTTSSSTPNR
jgi:hypothetical protein